MGMKEQNLVHRTMHILNVICRVSRFSRCTKIVGGKGFAPKPSKELIALPDHITGFKGPTSKTLYF